MAKLLISDGTTERQVELLDAVTTFGRAPENNVILPDKELSRRHFQIERTDQGFKLVDLESRNGTRVNDKFVNQHLLVPGDRVQVGKTTLTFNPDGAPGPAPVIAVQEPSSPPPAPLPPPDASPLPQGEPRRKSAGTTSIDKIRGAQRIRQTSEARREAKTLKTVGILAGGFIGLIIVLILVSSFTRKPPVDPAPGEKKPQNTETANTNTNPGTKEPTPEEKEEAALFNDIYALEKTLSTSYTRAIEKCKEYESRFPAGKNIDFVKRVRAEAEKKVASAGSGDFAKIDRKAKEHLKNGRYTDALREVNKALQEKPKYYKELVSLKETIFTEANAHYTEQIQKGFDLKDAGKRDEARAHFIALQREIGDADDLRGKLQIIEEALRSLQ